MSAEKDQNKEFILKAKELLKAKGYDVKTSHLYDVFAQLAGFKNWHVASAQNYQIPKTIAHLELVAGDNNGLSFKNYVNSFFYNREKQKINFNLQDRLMQAWNYAIAGSGRDVLLNKLLNVELVKPDKPMICILDYSGNGLFHKIIKIYNGTYINFAKQLPDMGLFVLSKYERMPSEDKLNEIIKIIMQNSPDSSYGEAQIKILLKEYFSQLSYNDGNENLLFEKIFDSNQSGIFYDKTYAKLFSLRIQDSIPNKSKIHLLFDIITTDIMEVKRKPLEGDFPIFEQMIISMYKKTCDQCRFPMMADFISEVESTLSQDMAINIIEKLKKWAVDGSYPMFDSNSSIDLSNDLIVVDFNGLESNPVVKKVYSKMIHSAVSNKMYRMKNRKKIIVRNEIEFLMKKENELEKTFFIEDLRTSRRNGMITITTTDLPTDYLKFGESGKAIVLNINCHLIGKINDKNDQFEVERLLGTELNDLNNNEFYKVIDNKYDILQNTLNNVEYFLCSYCDLDMKILNYYLKNSNMSVDELIIYIANGKHKEDAVLKKYLNLV